MKRRTSATWQPIASDMPAGIVVEIMRRSGVIELGVRLPPHWLMFDTILIARLNRAGEINDAIAWRDAPSRDGMHANMCPAAFTPANCAAFKPDTEEKIAA